MKLVIPILLFLIGATSQAQFGPRQIIDENSGSVRMVRTADFDQDGDPDIAVASANFIGWYENVDGHGNFGNPTPIQLNMGQSFNLEAADIDGDGFIDLAVSYFDQDQVLWYRNLGNGVFSTLNPIASNLLTARGIVAADIDGDADLDLVLGVSNGNGLYWVENLDGLGTFSSLITIDASISQARTQSVGDIDGDGDLDILTNAVGSTYLSWFENVDGIGSFTNEHIIDPIGLYENFIYLFDIDGDDALDILSQKSDTVIWRKNTDGLGTFSDFIVIGDETENPSDGIARDMDNDGDLDIVAAYSAGTTVAWFENLDGSGTFGEQIIIDSELQSPRTVDTADFDGDGDLDVVSAALSNLGRELVWYENQTILGVSNNQILTSISYYPNPVQDLLYIFGNDVEIQTIEIYNLQSKLVLEDLHFSDKIDLSILAAGIYIGKIGTIESPYFIKIVKQ